MVILSIILLFLAVILLIAGLVFLADEPVYTHHDYVHYNNGYQSMYPQPIYRWRTKEELKERQPFGVMLLIMAVVLFTLGLIVLGFGKVLEDNKRGAVKQAHSQDYVPHDDNLHTEEHTSSLLLTNVSSSS